MDELRDLALFVEVARTRSFQAAALRLGLPASTLSRRISALENAVGVRLLHRTTRRVELTGPGRHYLSRCEQIVDAARAAKEELSALQSRPSGLLRVSMSPDFGTTYMAPVIAEFATLYPEIELQIDLSPRRIDIVAEGFDLAIRIGAPSEPYLIARRLLLARRGMFASPSYLAHHPVPEVPADLVTWDFVTIDHPDSGNLWKLSKGSEQAEITVNGRVTANNPGIVLKLAAEGLGLAVVDCEMAARFLDEGKLQRVLPGWEPAPVPIYLVTASHVLAVKTRLFTDLVFSRFKGR